MAIWMALRCHTQLLHPTQWKSILIVLIWRPSCTFKATILTCLKDPNQCMFHCVWAGRYDYVPIDITGQFLIALITFEYDLLSWEPAWIGFIILLVFYTSGRWNLVLLARLMHLLSAIYYTMHKVLHWEHAFSPQFNSVACDHESHRTSFLGNHECCVSGNRISFCL